MNDQEHTASEPGGARMNLANLRDEYTSVGIDRDDLASDPFIQFSQWFQTILTTGIAEPNAMTVATATPDGHPSARVVLLKGFDERGFVFYTNYEGRKASELNINPWASAVFFWVELHRQVRIEGEVEQVSAEESDAYFASRPRGSQIGAWASHQSSILPDRHELEARVAALEAQWHNQPIPRPPFWGGYRIVPSTVEFWQGRASRLHDRLRYRRTADGIWVIERLSP